MDQGGCVVLGRWLRSRRKRDFRSRSGPSHRPFRAPPPARAIGFVRADFWIFEAWRPRGETSSDRRIEKESSGVEKAPTLMYDGIGRSKKDRRIVAGPPAAACLSPRRVAAEGDGADSPHPKLRKPTRRLSATNVQVSGWFEGIHHGGLGEYGGRTIQSIMGAIPSHERAMLKL